MTAEMPVRAAIVLGGTSLVGRHVLRRLSEEGFVGLALSRQDRGRDLDAPPGFTWGRTGLDPVPDGAALFTLAPITAVPPLLTPQSRFASIVALSTSSVFFKADSADPKERAFIADVQRAEADIQMYAEGRGIPWAILRPTLVYDPGHDLNVSAIARFILRFRVFPVLAPASGLRQPVHADDVAHAMIAAQRTPTAHGRILALPGGETLSYRDMVDRVFRALGRTPRILPLPVALARWGFFAWRAMTGSKKYSVEALTRMNRDLTVDGADARAALGFACRSFAPDFTGSGALVRPPARN